MKLYKYQGAGNDFLIADNRDLHIHLTPDQVADLCDRRYGIGADGLMLLEPGAEGYDFHMVYYNSDGSGGMMCGNGGRCIVAFGHRLGLGHSVVGNAPTAGNVDQPLCSLRFTAADGPHDAQIIARQGKTLTVRLGMKDVTEIIWHDDDVKGCYLDTGTRHLVCAVDDIDHTDVYSMGRQLRYNARFAPVGVNVNFIEPKGDTLWVRTYEKGVEAETYACGTGITASAIAAWHAAHRHGALTEPVAHVHQCIHALRDELSVDFTPTPTGACDVWLTGPATFVAEVIVDI